MKIAAVTALIVPPFIHAFAWRLWLGTYYGSLPEQLPSASLRTDD
jgi:ABC-type Fe3+ transport system permease subunit